MLEVLKDIRMKINVKMCKKYFDNWMSRENQTALKNDNSMSQDPFSYAALIVL